MSTAVVRGTKWELWVHLVGCAWVFVAGERCEQGWCQGGSPHPLFSLLRQHKAGESLPSILAKPRGPRAPLLAGLRSIE